MIQTKGMPWPNMERLFSEYVGTRTQLQLFYDVTIWGAWNC